MNATPGNRLPFDELERLGRVLEAPALRTCVVTMLRERTDKEVVDVAQMLLAYAIGRDFDFADKHLTGDNLGLVQEALSCLSVRQ